MKDNVAELSCESKQQRHIHFARSLITGLECDFDIITACAIVKVDRGHVSYVPVFLPLCVCV